MQSPENRLAPAPNKKSELMIPFAGLILLSTSSNDYFPKLVAPPLQRQGITTRTESSSRRFR